jgi:hypothetical protein
MLTLVPLMVIQTSALNVLFRRPRRQQKRNSYDENSIRRARDDLMSANERQRNILRIGSGQQ